MGWKPGVRWDKANRYFYTRHQKRKHYLGTDYAEAHRRFAEVVGRPSDSEMPAFIAEAAERWVNETGASDWVLARALAWLRYAGQALLADLDDTAIQQYADHLAAEGYAPNTVLHNIKIALRIARWCHKQGWLDQVPDRPTMAKPAEVYRDVPPKQLRRAFGKLEHDNPNACQLAKFILATGCRPSEARLLRWSEVNLDHGECRLAPARHKTAHAGQVRTIYLTPAALEILRTQPHISEFVFLSKFRHPYSPSGLRAALIKAGLPNAYSLRHTFAQTTLAQATMEDTARLLGHTNLNYVQVYAQIRDDRARRVASGLTDSLQRQPEPDRAIASPREHPADRRRSRRKPTKAHGRRAG